MIKKLFSPKVRSSFLCLGALVLLNNCGMDSGRPSDSDAQVGSRQLTNGMRIGEERYPAAVQIGTKHRTGQSRSLCTATFVSLRTLITAAHCVDRGGQTDVSIEKGPASAVGKKSIAVHMHPNFGKNGGGGDVAVVVFDQDIAASYLPVNLAAGRITVNAPLILLGYGLNNDRNPNSGGYKQVGWNTVTSLRSIGRTFSVAGALNGTGSGDLVSLSNGDSGGGAFVYTGSPNQETDMQLAGVASTKETQLVGGKHVGNHTNLSDPLHADWLRQIAQGGVSIAGINLGSSSPPPSTTARPESERAAGVKYITRLYNRVLKRQPAAAETDFHLGRWMSGADRCSVARVFTHSTERARKIVIEWYADYYNLPLVEQSSPQGVQFWQNVVVNSGTDALPQFLSSSGFDELIGANMPGLNVQERFVQGLFVKLLGYAPRAPETRLSIRSFVAQLRTNRMDRPSVVSALMSRDEYIRSRLGSMSLRYLDRAMPEWQVLKPQFQANRDERETDLLFTCSDEFFAASQR